MSLEQYEDITNDGTVIKSAKMDIGGSFQGTLTAIEASVKYPEKKNLAFEDADGNPFVVFTSGTLNYAVVDGKFEVGRTYRVTRLENKLTPKGASRTQYRIERLKSDGQVAGAPSQNTEKPAGKKGKSANGATAN